MSGKKPHGTASTTSMNDHIHSPPEILRDWTDQRQLMLRYRASELEIARFHLQPIAAATAQSW